MMNRYKCTLNTISIYYAKPYSAINTYAKINVTIDGSCNIDSLSEESVRIE